MEEVMGDGNSSPLSLRHVALASATRAEGLLPSESIVLSKLC